MNFLTLANDCAHILKAPHGNRLALLAGLVNHRKSRMGFRISHPRAKDISFLYREIFARQNYFFCASTESPLIFDCGANIGMATLYFKWLYPSARIVCFEPDQRTYEVLQRNVLDNRLNRVVAHNYALWDEDSQIDFFNDPQNPASTLMSAIPARVKGAAVKVSARRLSGFISEPIDFLKLDVEGAESRIISELVQSGAISLVKQMLIEYHHRAGNSKSCLAALLANLESAGFEYQIHASLYPATTKNTYQDILINAYR
jgi:FkbM family methyltransferase